MRNQKFFFKCSHHPHNYKTGHLTLLFRRERAKIPLFLFFYYLNMTEFDALITAVVVVAQASYYIQQASGRKLRLVAGHGASTLNFSLSKDGEETKWFPSFFICRILFFCDGGVGVVASNESLQFLSGLPLISAFTVSSMRNCLGFSLAAPSTLKKEHQQLTIKEE